MRSRGLVVTLAIAAALLPGATRAAGCDASRASYVLRGGDGADRGRAVLLFEDKNVVRMLEYVTHETKEERRASPAGSAVVTTDAIGEATPDSCGVVATGHVVGHTIRWETPMRSYHRDGTTRCWGDLCGALGLPRAGVQPLHDGPAPEMLPDFVLSADRRSFQAKDLAGTRQSEACARPPACTL